MNRKSKREIEASLDQLEDADDADEDAVEVWRQFLRGELPASYYGDLFVGVDDDT